MHIVVCINEMPVAQKNENIEQKNNIEDKYIEFSLS